MDYSAIARNLVEKNPSLEQLVLDNAGDNYTLVRKKLTPKVLSKLGETYKGFVKAHQLTWAIINVVEDEDSGDELLT